MSEKEKVNNDQEQLNNTDTVEVDSEEDSETISDEAKDDQNDEAESGENAQTVETELSEEEKLQQKIVELEDKLIRRSAEFENYKKRTARQFDEIVQAANDRIILEFLEVIDNFDRSFEHDDETNFESFKEGVKLIHNQMKGLLEKYNITPIEAVGVPFDPNLHEAMMQVESDEYEEGNVVMEINKGYKMGSRVIRHSRVGVAKPKEEEKEEVDSEESKEK